MAQTTQNPPLPDLDLVRSACQRAPMALQMLGDRWALLILRDAFLGARRFSEFHRSTGAPFGTLTARLRTLVEQGVMYRNPVGTNSDRFDYRLTGRGLDLGDFALAIWSWEHKWGGDSGLPSGLAHRNCRHLITPTLACGECRKPVAAHEVAYEPGPGGSGPLPNRAVSRRRESQRLADVPDVDRTFHRVIDVFGDRWTSRMLAAFLMGVQRYDDLGTALGISSNILSTRLRRLVKYGVVERVRNGSQWNYVLTPAGRDLFPAVMTIHKWSNRWAGGREGPAILIRHLNCQSRLDPIEICSRCGETLRLEDLDLRTERTGTRAARR